MWLLCNYIDYMWYMLINVIVLVMKVPLICVDEYFEVVTTCTIVACICGVVGLSYGITRLHKELFGIRRIGNVVEDVVNMMGMGMISVDVDGRDDNKKEGKRDVKWNKYVEGNEVLRGLIGEHGEGVEKVFKGMKEVNKGIEWEVDKDKGNVCENNNDDNGNCNVIEEYEKVSDELQTPKPNHNSKENEDEQLDKVKNELPAPKIESNENHDNQKEETTNKENEQKIETPKTEHPMELPSEHNTPKEEDEQNEYITSTPTEPKNNYILIKSKLKP